MSQQQNLQSVIEKLATTETAAGLQARLETFGIATDLSSVPAAKISETFIAAMGDLLARPIGELSTQQIRAITEEVQKANTALEQPVTAETILSGFKKLADGVIEITLPVGLTMQQAGEILNIAAKNKGMEYPVFYEGDKEFWQKNEADSKLQTTAGVAYKFTIAADSVSKTRDEQEHKYGQGAPLAAIALAEACERLNTENEGSLFKDADGDRLWVRGSAAGLALYSVSDRGVGVSGYFDAYRNRGVAFAAAVPARN